MSYPTERPRRLRSHPLLREMTAETTLRPQDFIYPLFVVPGHGIKKEIPSMPGQFHFSLDKLAEEIEVLLSLRIPAVILFGIPSKKDEIGSEAWDPKGIVQEAIHTIKKESSSLLVITDVCLCEYTSHGHCGIVKNGEVQNDPTLELLARTALSHAEAGADMVAPSDMMDGRVGKIRQILDAHGFSHIPIMAYSAKYASAFYGPFREAAESAPQFGDRQGYQMPAPNVREALRETRLDVEEGADIVMVKPALAYMDVIRAVRERFDLPVACYNVSGEYAMVKAAAQKGWIDEKRIVFEILTGLKRAGANLIITYHAKDAVRWLEEKSASEKKAILQQR
jgi:porphobilinogen synthase